MSENDEHPREERDESPAEARPPSQPVTDVDFRTRLPSGFRVFTGSEIDSSLRWRLYDDRSTEATVVTPKPEGGFDITRAQHQLESRTRTHELKQAELDADHRRKEEAKDNSHARWQRSILFAAIVVIVLALLVVSIGIIVISENETSKAQAWGMAGIIGGGVLGAAGGFAAGRVSK